MATLLARLVGWLVRRLGVHNLLSLGLLMVVLGSSVLGLADVIRGLNAAPLLPIALIGLLLGWMLACSPFPAWLAAGLSLVLGAEVIVATVGDLGPPALRWVEAVVGWLWETLQPPYNGAPDGTAVSLALERLGADGRALLSQTGDWLGAVFKGQAAFDPVVAPLFWSLAVWLAAVWAGWAVRRHRKPLQAITPAGALLLIALSYTWIEPNVLYPLLGATLLLLAMTGQIAREQRWQTSGIDYSLELRFEIGLAVILLSLALLFVAVFTPSVSIRPLVRVAQRFVIEHLGTGKQIADSMGLEPLGGPGTALGQAYSGGLPNRNLIGSGPELSEQIVMIVHPEGQMLAEVTDGPPSNVTGPRFYWRSVTYDVYNGRGWLTSETNMVNYAAGEPALLEGIPADASDLGDGERSNQAPTRSATQRVFRQQVQATQDLGGLLYRAGELVTADQDFRVAWRSAQDPFGAEIDAELYRVDSLVSVVSQAELRSAWGDYPQWVRDRYLALPPEVPERVRSLARDLTTAEPTTYDQARAIEAHLRAFTYTLDLPAPPPNREIADYFLFDLKRGYCDYYATTMVVLARAAGIPARVVSGYVGGEFDPTTMRYLVTAADAHSWVEVYFPTYGWVEFEPTGGRPPIERPMESAAFAITEPESPLEPSGVEGTLPLLWLLPLAVLLLLASGGIGWWALNRWRFRKLLPGEAVDRLYQQFSRQGLRLAVPARSGDTPHEFTAMVARRVSELSEERGAATKSQKALQAMNQLTDLYVRHLYSLHKPDAGDKARAFKMWTRLRRQLWRAWFWHKRSPRGSRSGDDSTHSRRA